MYTFRCHLILAYKVKCSQLRKSGKCWCAVEELSILQVTWGETLEEAADEPGRLADMGQGLELQRVMDVAITSLPEKEQVVVRCFYGLDGRPHTQGEVPLPLRAHSLKC